jgi:hypothetical protein
MLKYEFSFLLILAILMAACTQVKEKDLCGTYVAKYSFGIEKLTLNANGDYIQEVTIKDKAKTLIHKGHWRYAPEDKYIELKNALSVQDAFGHLKKDYNIPFNGFVLRKVKRFFSWSRIRLLSAYEEVQFEKISTKE